MQLTRQRIVDYLDQYGSATPAQLAKAFGMTAANLRRHLAILQDRGVVTEIGKVKAKSRGRPDHIFALIPSAKGNLEPLTSALLNTLDKGNNAIEILAQSLLGEHKTPTGQITQRLVNAVHKLEPLGYKPRWEARQQGPQMVFGRCPYSNIIADHPELCRMDSVLLEQLLGSSLEQKAKLQPGPQRIPQCIFILNKERISWNN